LLTGCFFLLAAAVVALRISNIHGEEHQPAATTHDQHEPQHV
jgi:hypothetical protein